MTVLIQRCVIENIIAKPIFCLNFIHEWHTYGKSHNQNGNFYCECDKFAYQSTKGGCDC